MGTDAKVLFVTAYCDERKGYEYWNESINKQVKYSYDISGSYGLRFIKENIPEINILEYPTFKRYVQELKKGYDVVGFSFYTHEIPSILNMVKAARAHNVPELWAGNYGALTYGVKEHFDKVFVGYGEGWIAEQLGHHLETIKHPIMVDRVNLPFGLGAFPVGILYTARGCTIGCHFCQASVFCEENSTIPLRSIDDAIKTYKGLGIDEILVLDEHFGLNRRHSELVVELLRSYGMNWYPLTSIDMLYKHLDIWYENGLAGAFMGIESLNQRNLDEVHKKLKVEQIELLFRDLEEFDIFINGTYIIGYENDTETLVKNSIDRLNEFSIDILQINVLTPLPRTKLWDHIDERYGIFERDWSKWDAKNLVWNHPHISKKDMKGLLNWCSYHAYPPQRLIQTPVKYFNLHKKRLGMPNTVKKVFSDVVSVNKKITKNSLP